MLPSNVVEILSYWVSRGTELGNEWKGSDAPAFRQKGFINPLAHCQLPTAGTPLLLLLLLLGWLPGSL